MELVRIISRNKTTKASNYREGHCQAIQGCAECVVRLDGRLQTRHCIDPDALPKAKDFQPEK